MSYVIKNAQDRFEWRKDLDLLMQNYDQDSNKGYLLEFDVNYPKELHKLQSDMSFLSQRMKIDKCEKLVCNLHDKKNYAIKTRALKQALDHGLTLQ